MSPARTRLEVVACGTFAAGIVTDYMEGALAPDERALVDMHLERCAPCRAELDELRFTVELLALLGPRREAGYSPPA